MAIKVADNFLYQGRKPLDNRIIVNTTADMVAMADAIIYDGIITYVKDIKKFYVYNSTNTVDATLGKWRPFTVDQASIKAYAKNTAYNKDDLVYLNEKLARVVNSFTSDNTGATVSDSYDIDVASGALIEISSDSFVIYETINTVSLEDKVGDTKSLTIADLNVTGLTLNDLKIDQLVYDSEGTIGKITNITSTGFDVVTITISGGEGGAAIYRTSGTLSPTLLDTTVILFTNLIVPTGITINELKVNDLVFDNDGTVGKIDSIDTANNKVAIMTITKSDNTNHMPLAPSVKELRIKNGGSGYAVGDIVQSTTAGVFAQVLTVSTSGTIASIGTTTATAQSTSGTGAIIDYDQIVYGGYGKNWAALSNAAVTNAQVIADTDDFDIGYDYVITTAGTGYAVGDIVSTNISNVFVEVMSVGTSGEILTVDFTRDTTQSTSGTGASITATQNNNIFIVPSDIWNKGVAVISLTNNDGASVEYYRTGDVLEKYGIGIDSRLYKFEYNEVKGVIKQSYTKLSGTGGCEVILGCFATVPTTFNQGNKYYNTTDNLIHTADSATTWDAGTTPSQKTIYLNKDDNKLYAYVDNVFDVYGGSGISSKAGNAIQNITGSTTPSENGLFVKDLEGIFNQISFIQKVSVGNVPKYFFRYTTHNTTASISTIPKTEINVMDLFQNLDTNMDASSYDLTSNGYVELRKGITYEINYQLLSNSTGRSYKIYDEAGNVVGSRGFMCNGQDTTNNFSDSSIRAIYTPIKDIKIFFKVLSSKTTADLYADCSYIYIREMNPIQIDPLQYVNTRDGIEDTPVGELITKIGTITPAHYLPCNGKEYNILDYPELAQCIKNEFGSFNYFGGDGVTTFAVPNYNSYNWWTPGLVNGAVPSPYAVYVSSVYDTTQYQKELLFDGIISKDSCWHSAADGSDTDIWVKFDFGSNTYINGLRMAVRSTTYLGQLPSTFTIEGSYDDVTYNVIKSYSSLPSPTSTDFREHLFDKPVNYRYYKLNHMTSNAKNNGHDYCSIAELEFAKVDSMSCIKYEPTYYMNVSGYEEVKELLNAPRSYANATTSPGTVTYSDSITLTDSIDSYDKIELAVIIEDSSTNRTFYQNTVSFRKEDIVYTTSGTVGEHSYQAEIHTITRDGLWVANLVFNFRDNKTIDIVRAGIVAPNNNPSVWDHIKLTRITGIRNASTASSGGSAALNTYSTTITGNGTDNTFTINHNLNTMKLSTSVYDSTTYEEVAYELKRVDANTVEISWGNPIATGTTYQVDILGW